MFKTLAKIFWNRLQVQLVDVLISTFTGTIQEWRRQNQEGQFDLLMRDEQQRNQERNAQQNNENQYPNHD